MHGLRGLRLQLVVVAAVTTVPAGCVSHVQIPQAPSAFAPAEERAAYYDAHAPKALASSTPAAPVTGPLRFVLLHDGTRVEAAEDLLPAVAEGSPAAEAAQKTEQLRGWSTALMATAGTGAAVGIGVMLASFWPMLMLNPTGGNDPATVDTAAGLALGTVLVGGVLAMGALAPLSVGLQLERNMQVEQDTAFLTYDMSLRRQLGLREPHRLPSPPPDDVVDDVADQVTP